MTSIERRFTERFGIKIPVRVRIAKPTPLERTAESLNISTRGILFANLMAENFPLFIGM